MESANQRDPEEVSLISFTKNFILTIIEKYLLKKAIVVNCMSWKSQKVPFYLFIFDFNWLSFIKLS